MPKWNGGVIGVANNPTQNAAKGVWSLSEATKAIRAGLWPPSNAGADPYFENVTLLLPGDGTNGAQNNTFLDSSTNNFTITRNGNTTQGTFSPFSKVDGRWGAYFDGSGDYLALSNVSALQPGTSTNAFCIECWIYPTATPGTDTAVYGNFKVISYPGNCDGVDLLYSTSRTLALRWGYPNYNDSGVSSAIALNTWHHVVIARNSSGSMSGYINGSRWFNTSTNTSITTATAASFWVGWAGSLSGTTVNPFPGYMSNFRFVKGSTPYDPTQSTLTVPTAPLTAITDTSLLTCQSNRFIDNSTNAFAITRNGDVSVQTFSPFPTMTAYAAGTNGGSGYFDGTGDFLTASYSTSSFDWWTGDYTLEAWVYPTSLSGWSYIDGPNAVPTLIGNSTTTSTPSYFSFGPMSDGSVMFRYWNGSASNVVASSAGLVRVNQWNHIQLTKSSSGIRVGVNGTSTSASAVSGTPQSSSSLPLTIGQINNTAINGYVSGLRVVKGTALYDATTYTVPTAPPTAITNTSLLLNFTNGGIIDTSMSNDLETVGNAQISTTQSKFGGGSMSFDGNGDVLAIRNSRFYDFSSGDFTVEFWFRTNTLTPTPPSSGASGFAFIIGQTNWNGTSGNGWCLFQKNQTLEFYAPASTLATIATGNVISSTSTWYHIAIVRSGTATNNTKIYINGTQEAQGTPTFTYSTQPLMIGGISSAYGWDNEYITNGYIDDLRITKGYARYTANFTAPASPFNGFGD